jgi:hypothetical protein
VKKKISVAALIMSGCVMMVFAATKADPCTEKHKSCTDSCAITQSQSQRRGVDRLDAENAFKQCVNACDKAKADCDGKAKKP